MRRVIVVFLCWLIIIPVSVEMFLRAADPLGMAYFEDTNVMLADAKPTDIGYALPIGNKTLSHWSYTMTDTGRVMPSSTGPRVDFVGDSVTFGYGVEDAETFAYTLADRLDLNARNTALTGYNAAQVASLIASSDAEYIVYLSFYNDAEPPIDVPREPGYSMARLSTLFYIMTRTRPPVSFDAAAMDAITADERVLTIAFDDEYGRALAERWTVVLIPNYTDFVSFADPHPSAAGHDEIAEALEPILREFIYGSGP